MTKSWDDWNISPELAKRISDEWAKIFERKTPLSPPLTVMSRLHEADEPGKIEGLLNYDHINLPMTYEAKMTIPDKPFDWWRDKLPGNRPEATVLPGGRWHESEILPAWGLTPPAMIVIPPDRPDVEQALRSVLGLTAPLIVMSVGPRFVQWDDANDITDWGHPAGTGLAGWWASCDRRRQKRLDRGIKLKAPPSRGWARHIRKQKARRGR